MEQRARSSALVASIVAAVAVMLATSGAAWARYGFDDYTYERPCSGIKDPVNIFFYNFDWNQAETAVRTVLGLTWDVAATDQWFRYRWLDGTIYCRTQVFNRASWFVSPREHTRLRDNRPVDVYVTASPIHHDDWALCGDVATSFNGPRDWAAGRFGAARYPIGMTWIGNTRAIRQCDGRFVASDGWALRVDRP